MEHASDKSNALRRKAEELLRKRGVGDKSLYNQSLESLVEELSVFQIELEQQNQELILTQQELEKSKAQYLDLYHHAPVGYLTIDSNYRVVEANQTGAKMLQTDTDTLESQEFIAYIDKQHQDTFYFHIRRTIIKQQKAFCELMLHPAGGGEKLIVQLESIPYTIQGKTVMRSALLDITEKRIVEEKAQESEEKFRNYVEHSPTSIAITDAAGNYKYINEATTKLMGYSWEEMLLMNAGDIIQSPDSENLKAIFRTLKEKGNLQNREYQIKHKNGNIKDLVLNAIKLGEDTFLAFSTDISPQKELQRKLVQEKEKWEHAFHAISDGMVIVNAAALVREANPAFLNIIGQEAEKVLGRNLWTILHGQMDIPAYSPLKADFNKREIPQQIYWEPHLRKYLAIQAFPVWGTDGQFEFVVITLRDTTDAQEARKVLEMAKQKAEESDMLKSAFLANMSHEIRTPLNAILGFIDLVEKNNLPEAQRSRFLGIIRSNGQYLLQLINDIIDIAKIESNQITLFNEVFDLNNLLMEIVLTKQNDRIFKQKSNLQLKLAIEDQNPFYIKSDPIRFKQIIINLLNNAIKFTQDGYVRLGYKLVNGVLEFFVEDTGTGIARDKQELIFNRFGQADPTNKKAYGGTGLGLSISLGLVKLLGGAIRLESELGKGTTFYFTIDAAIRENHTESKQENQPLAADDYDFNNKTVMIVEDEQSNFLFLQALLKATGISIFRAETGHEAIDLMQVHPEIDFILMDIKLPDMDGIEATRIIKANHELPVIAQTAHAFAEDKQKALSAGCDAYLTKPLDKDLLLQTIDKLVR